MLQKSLLTTLLFLLASQTGKSQTTDETALKNVMAAETKAFMEMSIADLARKFWLLDEKTQETGTSADGVHYIAKKEDILAITEKPPGVNATFNKTNYRFIVSGDMASVSYDQEVTIMATGDKIYSHEWRIFRRIDNEWKIHLSSVHQYTP